MDQLTIGGAGTFTQHGSMDVEKLTLGIKNYEIKAVSQNHEVDLEVRSLQLLER
jgi:hypothetical protein